MRAFRGVSTIAFVLGAAMVGGTVLLVRSSSAAAAPAAATPWAPTYADDPATTPAQDASGVAGQGAVSDDGTTTEVPSPTNPSATTTVANDGLGIIIDPGPAGGSGTGTTTGGNPNGAAPSGQTLQVAPASTGVQSPLGYGAGKGLVRAVLGNASNVAPADVNAVYKSSGAAAGALW